MSYPGQDTRACCSSNIGVGGATAADVRGWMQAALDKLAPTTVSSSLAAASGARVFCIKGTDEKVLGGSLCRVE